MPEIIKKYKFEFLSIKLLKDSTRETLLFSFLSPRKSVLLFSNQSHYSLIVYIFLFYLLNL